jgi:hypothetical protein
LRAKPGMGLVHVCEREHPCNSTMLSFRTYLGIVGK